MFALISMDMNYHEIALSYFTMTCCEASFSCLTLLRLCHQWILHLLQRADCFQTFSKLTLRRWLPVTTATLAAMFCSKACLVVLNPSWTFKDSCHISMCSFEIVAYPCVSCSLGLACQTLSITARSRCTVQASQSLVSIDGTSHPETVHRSSIDPP